MYKTVIRPLLFKFDPEKVHYFTFSALEKLNKVGLGSIFKSLYKIENKKLERNLFGLTFPNPVGLAAGFDKDAKLYKELSNCGFGFIEIGTVTPKPQEGNPKKRLFRLKEDQAIINRMGFNNGGVDEAVERLKENPKLGHKNHILIGGNIGKNKNTPNEEAVNDYLICFEKLFDFVDYFVVNVSSPNTPNLRELQEKEPLTKLLLQLQVLNETLSNKTKGKNAVTERSRNTLSEKRQNAISEPGPITVNEKIKNSVIENSQATVNEKMHSLVIDKDQSTVKEKIQNAVTERSRSARQKPILLKIAPDLTDTQLLDIIDIVAETKIDGIIATNTTISREGLTSKNKPETGGLSGKPLKNRSTEVIRFLAEKSNKAFPIIGVGGIHSAEDALEKLTAGASLLQLYTGFIYEGPNLVTEINKAIINRTKE